MPKAKAKLKPKAKPAPAIPEAAMQLMDVRQAAAAIRVCRATFYAMVSAGEYPRPDLRIGRSPRWRVSTHNAWVEKSSNG